jgi:hypothetical protein
MLADTGTAATFGTSSTGPGRRNLSLNSPLPNRPVHNQALATQALRNGAVRDQASQEAVTTTTTTSSNPTSASNVDASSAAAPASATDCVQAALLESGEPVQWRKSTSVGSFERGRLVNGVKLPEQGKSFTTWDPGDKVSPSRQWRHWGADHVIRTVLCVTSTYQRQFPGAARVVIGDISLPTGGEFSRDYGGLGHASHQNGLDIDVYYIRSDRAETAATQLREIDTARSQQLLNYFVASGAITIYIGAGTHLTGPRGIVTLARKHQDHMHVRFPKTLPPITTTTTVSTPTSPTTTST